MSDEKYIEALARSWHKHVQEVNREWGFVGSEVYVPWDKETDNAKNDIKETFRRIINDGLIPGSEDWEWEATFNRMVKKLSEMTPEDHERLLKSMGMKEVKTSLGTFRIIPRPLLKEEEQ